jgi:hypothetical protein
MRNGCRQWTTEKQNINVGYSTSSVRQGAAGFVFMVLFFGMAFVQRAAIA